MSDLGEKLTRGLEELRDALESGQPLEDRFRVVERRRVVNPETGEVIDSRVDLGKKDEDDAV